MTIKLRNIIIIPLIAALSLLAGCNDSLDNSNPASVTTSFWTSLSGENPDSAKAFVTEPESTTIYPIIADSVSISVGDARQEDGYYFVDTSLHIVKDGTLSTVPLKTILIASNGEWKVDYWSSRYSSFDTTLSQHLESLARAASDSTHYLPFAIADENIKEAEAEVISLIDSYFDQTKALIIEEYKNNIFNFGKQSQ